MAQGRLPGLHRPGRLRPRPPRVAGRDRRDRGPPDGWTSGGWTSGGWAVTFSLTARDPLTGAFGIVVSSSSPAVAARCAHLAAGAGAVASQNVTNPALGIRGLTL